MRLPELEDDDKKTKKLRLEWLSEGWKDIKVVLHYQSLPYVPKVICSKLISRYYDNSPTDRFGIEKTWELIARKYYWPILQRDVKTYVKGCNIYLASIAVCHKPYGDLQSLPVLTHRGKDLLIDFVTGFTILDNWKSKSYKLILVIVDQLTKMVHYKPVKVTINALSLAKVIINMVMYHHGVPELIVMN